MKLLQVSLLFWWFAVQPNAINALPFTVIGPFPSLEACRSMKEEMKGYARTYSCWSDK